MNETKIDELSLAKAEETRTSKTAHSATLAATDATDATVKAKAIYRETEEKVEDAIGDVMQTCHRESTFFVKAIAAEKATEVTRAVYDSMVARASGKAAECLALHAKATTAYALALIAKSTLYTASCRATIDHEVADAARTVAKATRDATL